MAKGEPMSYLSWGRWCWCLAVVVALLLLPALANEEGTKCSTPEDCLKGEWVTPGPDCVDSECVCPSDTCKMYTRTTTRPYEAYYCGLCGALGSQCNATHEGVDCTEGFLCMGGFCKCDQGEVFREVCIQEEMVPTSVSSLVLIVVLVFLLVLNKLISSRETLAKCFCRQEPDDEETTVIGFNPRSSEKTAAYTIANNDFMAVSNDPDLDWALELSRQYGSRGEDWISLGESTWSSNWSPSEWSSLEGSVGGGRPELELLRARLRSAGSSSSPQDVRANGGVIPAVPGPSENHRSCSTTSSRSSMSSYATMRSVSCRRQGPGSQCSRAPRSRQVSVASSGHARSRHPSTTLAGSRPHRPGCIPESLTTTVELTALPHSSTASPSPSTTTPAPFTTTPAPFTTAPAPFTTTPAPFTTAPHPSATAPPPSTTAPPLSTTEASPSTC